MKIKVLVTGANGQLGKAITEVSEEFLSVIDPTFVEKSELDITKKKQLDSFFKNRDFEYCINCAAYTNVDLAEEEKQKSYDVNAFAVKYLAEVCQTYNIILIHLSTDYVFDGTKNLPYLESDFTNPINVYGQSKLLGEHHIKEFNAHHFIIRTSWLYSKFKGNFVEKIYHKLSNNEQLTVITSQKGVPTSCTDLAHFLLMLIASRITDFGTYHFAPNGETTWYGLALHIAEFLNKSSNVTAIEDYKSKARRPAYSVLANHKAAALLAKPFKNWSESVDEVLNVLSVE